jgi:hypothetical protein
MPTLPTLRIIPDNDQNIYVHKGETHVCQEGHPIATAAIDLTTGQIPHPRDWDFIQEQAKVWNKVKCSVEGCTGDLVYPGGYLWFMAETIPGQARPFSGDPVGGLVPRSDADGDE